jgi:ketosteroid isomerase-like protein
LSRKATVVWSFLAIASSAVILLKSNGQSNSPEREVRDVEQQANAAYEANDLAKYFSFYADDFTQYLPEGRTDLPAYKKEWTEYIGAGNRIEKVQLSDMHVQIGPSGDTAVASYILSVRTKLKDGKITEEDNQESDVLFKRNGQWRVVFLHYSAAPKKDTH